MTKKQKLENIKNEVDNRNSSLQESEDLSKKIPLFLQIETILFASGDPISKEKLGKFLRLSGKKFKEEVNKLKKYYLKNCSGLQIVEKGSRIQLVTVGIMAKKVAEFLGKAMKEELSKATLETLAVVAYRGPVTRAQIEYIRGVNCSFALRTLALRGIVEKKENPLDSRAYLYEVSLEFLKSLGLKRVEDLNNYNKLSKELKKNLKENKNHNE